MGPVPLYGGPARPSWDWSVRKAFIYEIEVFHWLQDFVSLLNPLSIQVADMSLMYHLTPSIM